MEYKRISIDELEVNRNNVRHSNLESEAKAMEWLLKDNFEEMLTLFSNIAHRGKLAETLLVEEKNGKYLVHDGNRRVTCLKILSGNVSGDFNRSLYKKLRSKLPTNYIFVPFLIDCLVESDPEAIDAMLEARHLGKNSGAGQVAWNSHQEKLFFERKEKAERVSFERKLSAILISNGDISEKEINLSILGTLFKDDSKKERLGFRVNSSKEIEFTKDEKKVREALIHIVKDEELSKYLFNSEKQNEYFNNLENLGVLPKVTDILEKPVLVKYSDIALAKPASGKKGSRAKKNFFITKFPKLQENDFLSPKMIALFDEFNKKLNIEKHSISMIIVFRSVLEILVNNYIEKYDLLTNNGIPDNKEARRQIKLKDKFKYVVKHLEEVKQFNKKITKDTVQRFGDYKFLASLNTINEVVHNDFDMPPRAFQSLGKGLEEVFYRILVDLSESAGKNSPEFPLKRS